MRHVRIFVALALLSLPSVASACQRLPSVFFAGGSTEINAPGHDVLSDFAVQSLGRLDRIRSVRIIGHTDRTGSPAARRHISLRRAEAVRDLLIARGIPARLLAASGAGDSQPLVETEDNVREPMNRRVEIEVIWAPAPPVSERPTQDRAPPVLC